MALDAQAHDSEEFDVSGVRHTLLIVLVFGVAVGLVRGVSDSPTVMPGMKMPMVPVRLTAHIRSRPRPAEDISRREWIRCLSLFS